MPELFLGDLACLQHSHGGLCAPVAHSECGEECSPKAPGRMRGKDVEDLVVLHSIFFMEMTGGVTL